MGILRLWLALAVVSAHVGPVAGYRMIGGRLAVECFYMISGFYMALVLDQKYSRSSWVFLFNRVVRLYPVYLTLSVLALALPWIFEVSKASGRDRAVGELSYAVYLGHWLVWDLLNLVNARLGIGPVSALPVMLGSMALAWSLRQAVEKPCDRWRHALSQRWMGLQR